MTTPPMIRAMVLKLALTVMLAAGPAQGQGLAFGTGTETSAPVEVEADQLNVSQGDGTAVFEGNVVVTQAEMRMSAAKLLVVYDDSGSRISRLEATGGVTLVSGEDAAESQTADYDVESGEIVMRGSVLVAQGENTVAGEVLRVNLATGNAQMDGRVRTTLPSAAQSGNN